MAPSEKAQQLAKKAAGLLAKIRKSNSDFKAKTDRIIANANKASDELGAYGLELEAKLRAIESDAAKKIDALVADYISSLDEKEEIE